MAEMETGKKVLSFHRLQQLKKNIKEIILYYTRSERKMKSK